MKFFQKMKYKKKSWFFALLLILTGTFFTFAVLQGQNTRSSVSNREIWKLWRSGFEEFENAELKMISRKYPEAIAHYENALKSFRRVRQLNPRWNKDVIGYRINRAERRIEIAREKYQELLPAAAQKAISSHKPVKDGKTVNANYSANIKKLDAENTALRQQLKNIQSSLTRARVQAATSQAAAKQVKELLEEREKRGQEIAELKLKINELEKLRLTANAQHDKLLLEEKARSNSLAKVIHDQNREMIDVREKLRTVSLDKTILDNRIRQVQKNMEDERTLSAAQLKQAKSQSDKLQKDLEQNLHKLQLKEKELLQVRDDRETLQKKINQLQTSGNASNLAIKQTQSENALLRNKLETVSRELSTLKEAKTHDSSRISQLEKEKTSLQNALAANIKQRNEYGSMNDSFVKKIDELEKEIINLKKENTRLAAAEQRLSAERRIFADKVNKSIPLEKELTQLRKQNRILASEEKLLKTRLANMEKAEKDAKKRALDAGGTIIALQARIASLDAERSAANTRIHQLQTEKISLDRKLANLADELKNKNSAQAAVNTRLALLQNEKEALQKKIENLNTLQLQKDAAKSASDAKAAILMTQKAALEKRIDSYVSLNEKKIAADQKVATLLLQLQGKEKELAERSAEHKQQLEKTVQAYKTELNNAVAKQLKAEVALQNALNDKKLLADKVSAAEKRAMDLQKTNTLLAEKNISVEKQAKDLQKTNTLLADKAVSMEKQAKDLQKTNTLLAGEVKNMPGLHVQIRKLTWERDMAKKALEALKTNEKSSKDLTIRNTELTGKLALAEKELAEMKEKSGQMGHLLQQITSLRVQAEKLKETEKQLSLLEKHVKELQDREKALLATHVKKDALQAAEGKLQQLQKETIRLKGNENRIAELEKEILELKKKEKIYIADSSHKADLQKAQKQLILLQEQVTKLQLSRTLAQNYKRDLDLQKEKLQKLEIALKGNEQTTRIYRKESAAKIALLEKSVNDLTIEKERLTKENKTLYDKTKVPSVLALRLQNAENMQKTWRDEKAKYLAQLQAYKEDTARMMKDMERLVVFRNKALTERNKLAAELKELKGTAKSADEKIMELEKSFLAAQQKLEETGKKHAEETQKNLAAQNESIAALQKVNNEYLLAIGKANIEKERLEKENTKLKTELEKATRAALAAVKYQEDSNKLPEVEKALAKSKAETTLLLDQIKFLQENLQKVSKENLTLQSRSEQLNKEHIKLASEREQWKKSADENAVYKTISAKQKEELQSLQKEYSSLSSRQETLEAEHKKAKAELAKWQNAEDPLIVRMRELIATVKDDHGKNSTLDQTVMDELVREIAQERQKQTEALSASVTAYNEAVRERKRADMANAAARKAMLDAVRIQSEMTILKKDIEDGKLRKPTAEVYAKAEKSGREAVYTAEKALTKTVVPLSALRIPLKHGSKQKSVVFRSTNTLQKAPEVKIPEQQKVSANTLPKTPESKKQSPIQVKKPVQKEKIQTGTSGKLSEEARKRYESAMKDGLQAEKDGDYSMALWHYWQAADAGENMPEPYLALARLNLKRNEKEAAEKSYQKALQFGASKDEKLEKELKLAPEK